MIIRIVATLFAFFTFAVLLMPIWVCVAFLFGVVPWYSPLITLVITLIYACPLVKVADELLDMAIKEANDE